MLLHITHDDPANRDYGPWFADYLIAAAGRDRFRVHFHSSDPEAADAILIVSRGDEFSTDLRHLPLVRRHYLKCFVYDVRDRPIPFLSGLYASLPRKAYDSRKHRTVGYVAPINDAIAATAAQAIVPDLLCSFVGGPTAKVRKSLFHSNPFGDRADVIIRNSYGWALRDLDPAAWAAKSREFAELAARSRFVLCPRGIGTSSVRLFETMELGRVPVILSDDWVPPTGPEWERFSLRVAEHDWEDLPAILESRQERAREMGTAARAAWQEWFGPESQFHRLAGWIQELQAGGRSHSQFDRLRSPFLAGRARLRKASVNLVKSLLRVVRRS